MALLIFGANLVQYTQKVMTSIAIVCMVNYTWLEENNSFEILNISLKTNNTCFFKSDPVLSVNYIFA